MFGWCNTNEHNKCPVEYERFYVGMIGRGRNKTQGPIYTGETKKCNCKCHKEKK